MLLLYQSAQCTRGRMARFDWRVGAVVFRRYNGHNPCKAIAVVAIVIVRILLDVPIHRVKSVW